MKCLLYILPILSFLGFEQNSYAQDLNKEIAFSSKTGYFDIIYTPPKGFTPFEGNHNYSCGPGEGYFDALNYTIINSDSTVVIGFSLLHAPNKKLSESLKVINPGADFNTNYIRTAKSLADTVNDKLIVYKKSYSKRKFNADDAGEYYHSCLALYDNKYPYKKVVFGFKKDIAQFEITYFYTERSKPIVDKIIKSTAGIIKFNSDQITSN